MRFRLVEERIDYNANPQGRNEGDCTIRALSLAYDEKYDTVKTELNRIAHNTHSKFNSESTIEEYINNHGYIDSVNNDEEDTIRNISVGDLENSRISGTVVALCSNRPKQDRSSSFHLVTIINGKSYDTWDSSDYYVIKYWTVKRTTDRNYKFDIRDFEDFIKNTINKILISNGKSLDKYNISYAGKMTATVNLEVNDISTTIRLNITDKDKMTGEDNIKNILQDQIETGLKKVL